MASIALPVSVLPKNQVRPVTTAADKATTHRLCGSSVAPKRLNGVSPEKDFSA
ncbi:hypothetical protein ACFS07_12315 [Undibacterium arcticum]